MYLKQIKNLQLLYISCERFSGYSLASFLLEVSRALESSSFDFELLPMTRPAMPPMTIVPVKLPVGTCKISFTPLKSKITLENHSCLIGYIYIFKWWICSLSCLFFFGGGNGNHNFEVDHIIFWVDIIILTLDLTFCEDCTCSTVNGNQIKPKVLQYFGQKDHLSFEQ